jgi:hypothetical protein
MLFSFFRLESLNPSDKYYNGTGTALIFISVIGVNLLINRVESIILSFLKFAGNSNTNDRMKAVFFRIISYEKICSLQENFPRASEGSAPCLRKSASERFSSEKMWKPE